MMTRNGYENLLSKIENLSCELREINKAVAEGMEDRDFREDSTFSVAVQERTKVQKKIFELEDVANNCTIADIDSNISSIDFGKSAKLLNVDTEEVKQFTIVGTYESAPKEGKISYLSPLGMSMMGSKVGDEFEVVTPLKETYWEVLEIFVN
jgi:transcription elongation factor GreA